MNATPAPPPQHPADERHLSIEDIAERTGLSRDALYRAVKRGDLRARKLRSRILVPMSAYLEWLAEGEIDAAPPAPEPLPLPKRARPRASAGAGTVDRLRAIEGGQA